MGLYWLGFHELLTSFPWGQILLLQTKSFCSQLFSLQPVLRSLSRKKGMKGGRCWCWGLRSAPTAGLGGETDSELLPFWQPWASPGGLCIWRSRVDLKMDSSEFPEKKNNNQTKQKNPTKTQSTLNTCTSATGTIALQPGETHCWTKFGGT